MVLCLLWMVLGPSSLTLVLTLAEPAMVFILLELRELEEFGVCRVPEGLSATSCDERTVLGLLADCLTNSSYLRRTRESPAKPGVSQGGVGRHPGSRVPLQTPPDEV